MTRVETDRVTKIDIRPYDQVFALTQYIINSGLEERWQKLVKQSETFSTPFEVGNANAGEISGIVLDYPRIVVETGYAEDLSGVLYMVCFKSAWLTARSYKYEPGTGNKMKDKKGKPIVEELEIDMSGWRLAFHMLLGMTVQERESEAFKKIVLNAGEYTLNHLVAKFETATFASSNGYYGDRSWDGLATPEKDALEFCITKVKIELLDRLKEASFIGKALVSNKAPNKPGLYFNPYKIQYQTYPWIHPGALDYKPTSGLTGNQKLNYLLYCETTNGHPLPPSEQRFLKRNGNWTDGRLEASANSENCDFGAFHMARENFFNEFLLKKLRVLNRLLEPWATHHWVKLHNVFDLKADWGSDLKLGQRSDKNENDSFYDFTPLNGKSTEWQFYSSLKLGEQYDQAGAGGWSGYVKASLTADCQNDIWFSPGADIIHVKGRNYVDVPFEFLDKKVIGSNIQSNKRLKYYISWSMDLDLEAVDDGGLQILTTFKGPEITYVNQDLATDSASRIKQDAEAAKTAFTSVRDSLINDLKGKQGLILPAEGVFFFKNPILSHRGDLICNIAYSNVPPEKAFDPADTTKINEDAKPRAT